MNLNSGDSVTDTGMTWHMCIARKRMNGISSIATSGWLPKWLDVRKLRKGGPGKGWGEKMEFEGHGDAMAHHQLVIIFLQHK